MKQENLTIIAGPCAAESAEQLRSSAKAAKRLGVGILRASLWKPRTRWDAHNPDSGKNFDGLGAKGLSWLADATTEFEIMPATEVLLPQHAEMVMKEILIKRKSKVVLWLGSRNQNHLVQREIGSLIEGHPDVRLVIKNQPWKDEGHWLGIVDHVSAGGADKKQLLLCHRGFAPAANGLRNPPDFAIAERVKLTTGLPLIGDPSHCAGESQDNVIKMARKMMAQKTSSNTGRLFDGLMIEVHPNAKKARTDQKQQLDWEQMRALLHWIRTQERR